MALTESQIQELYIAYFGRPADVEGKNYWSGSSAGVSTQAEFAAIMHAQSEFQNTYGSLSTAAQVDQIYQNLFSRSADSTGLAYWTAQISSGALKLAEIATHLIGYLGEVNTEKTKEDKYYTKGDLAGVNGIEAAYEEKLRGEKGMIIKLVDVHNRDQGKFQNGKYDTLAIPGVNLTSTIDIELQKYIYDIYFV